MKTLMPREDRAAIRRRNALHAAELHIEMGNAPKIAEALKDVSALEALEYLFNQAERHRLAGKHGKAASILEAARLVDRKTGETTLLGLAVDGQGADEKTTLLVRRFDPKEVFESPL